MKRTTGKAGRTSAAVVLCILAFLIALLVTLVVRLWPDLAPSPKFDPAFYWPSPFELASLPTATRFDFPLGNENGAFAYNAQRFTENRHLGDDLNGIGGENSDFGDPIFAVADGRILITRDGGKGWGNVMIVMHAYEENGVRKYVQSYYGHVEKILVAAGKDVRRGQQIATVGNANGAYLAHLHFEMREFITPFVGPGYRTDARGWINPSEFIAKHRGAPDDDVGRPPLD
jgi:hypothetical protein